MYTKLGGVAACHIVWIGLCLRSVPGVRVLASAVDIFSCSLFLKIKFPTIPIPGFEIGLQNWVLRINQKVQ